MNDIISYNFYDVVDKLKEYLRSSDEWKDVNLDTGIVEMIVNILAYSIQMNSSIVNSMVNDIFPHLTMSDRVLLDFCEFIDYSYKRAKSATGKVRFYVENLLNKNIVIYPYTRLRGDNNKIYLTTNANNVLFGKDNLFVELDVIEGEWVNIRNIADGNNDFKVYIYDNVEKNNLYVYVNGELYSEVNNFLFSKGIDKVYIVRRIKDGIYIMFGNGVFGVKLNNGDIVDVKYLKTSGKEGNIVSSGINKIIDILYYEDGVICNDVKVNVINNGTLFNGEDVESFDDIRRNISKYLKSSFYLVTKNDYRQYLLANDLIIDVVVKAGFEVYNKLDDVGIINSLYCISSDGFNSNVGNFSFDIDGDNTVNINDIIIDTTCFDVVSNKYYLRRLKLRKPLENFSRLVITCKLDEDNVTKKAVFCGIVNLVPVSQFYNTVYIYVLGNTSGYILSDNDKMGLYEYLKQKDIFFLDVRFKDINVVNVNVNVDVVLSNVYIGLSEREKIKSDIYKSISDYLLISKEKVLKGDTIFKNIYKAELIHKVFSEVSNLKNLDMNFFVSHFLFNFNEHQKIYSGGISYIPEQLKILIKDAYEGSNVLLNKLGEYINLYVNDENILCEYTVEKYNNDYLVLISNQEYFVLNNVNDYRCFININKMYYRIEFKDDLNADISNKKFYLYFKCDNDIVADRFDIIFNLLNVNINM